MTIERFPDAEAVSRAAADEFVRLAGAAILARGRFAVVLSGGSTPKRMYQLLAEPEWASKVDWPKVHLFWGDERAVPPDHPDSNYGMAKAALLDKLPGPGPQVHRMEAEQLEQRAGAAALDSYRSAIATVFGVARDGDPPSFDLILLGMGPDGHTASLFPHTTALGQPKRWVVGNFVPKFNAMRMTFTATLINRAAEVLFLVAGADKAAVLAEVLEGPPDPDRLPSQLIKPAGRLRWFVDAAAAADLSGGA
jgi:6-phosphogluconolactonase